MGLQALYDRHLMPRFVTLACSQGQIMKCRSQVVPLARGRVFELGVGGGLNQQFYRTGEVKGFAGIDPHEKLLDDARLAAVERGWNTEIVQGVGEDIPFPDRSFDTAVCTYTLCSVDDPQAVLGELRRILKPGGRLLFLEHGRAPDADTARWQNRIEPVWKRLAGGCHLTRPIGGSLRQAGFDVEPMGQGYLPKTPRFAGWMEWGVARKAGA